MRILMSLFVSLVALTFTFQVQARVSYKNPKNFLMSFEEFKDLSKGDQEKVVLRIMQFMGNQDQASRAKYADFSNAEKVMSYFIDEAQASGGNAGLPGRCIYAGWVMKTKLVRDRPQCSKSEFDHIITKVGDREFKENVWCERNETVKCNTHFFPTCGAVKDFNACSGTKDGACCVPAREGATKACVNFGEANLSAITSCIDSREGAKKLWDLMDTDIKGFCKDLVSTIKDQSTGKEKRKYSTGHHVVHNEPDCTALLKFSKDILGDDPTPPKTEVTDACNGSDSSYSQVCVGYDKVEQCQNRESTFQIDLKRDKDGKIKGLVEGKDGNGKDQVIYKAQGYDDSGNPLAPIPLTKEIIKQNKKSRDNPIHHAVRPKPDFDLSRLGRAVYTGKDITPGDHKDSCITDANGLVDATDLAVYLRGIGTTPGITDAATGVVENCTAQNRGIKNKNEGWKIVKVAAGNHLNGTTQTLPFRLATGYADENGNPACKDGPAGACTQGIFVCARTELKDKKTGAFDIKELGDYFVVNADKQSAGDPSDPKTFGKLKFFETGTFFKEEVEVKDGKKERKKKGTKVPRNIKLYKAGDNGPTLQMSQPYEFEDSIVYAEVVEDHCPDSNQRASSAADRKPFNKVLAKYKEEGSKKVLTNLMICHAGEQGGKYETLRNWVNVNETIKSPEVMVKKLTLTSDDNGDTIDQIDLGFNTDKPDAGCFWKYKGEEGSYLSVNRDGSVGRKIKSGPREKNIISR